MSYVESEIASQPACWQQAAELAPALSALLPRPGERLAVVGCGTSLFMSQAFAALREATGAGETDAFPASEMPTGRTYDRVLVLTRSGTTTEVLDLLAHLRGAVPTVAITAAPAAEVVDVADEVIVLDFAAERSVVQTRFATTALMLLRAHLGHDVFGLVADAKRAVEESLPTGATERTQFTFLGRHWTIGLANEAALKMREASLAWAEAYPAMEYRHGPISVSDERSVVWALGEPPIGLPDEVRATGALWVAANSDPVAQLIRAQRLAVAVSLSRGLDPDRPRYLSHSVVLERS